jgi:hypothetical protein
MMATIYPHKFVHCPDLTPLPLRASSGGCQLGCQPVSLQQLNQVKKAVRSQRSANRSRELQAENRNITF